MKITVECRDCGKVIKADLAQLIKTLIDCTAHDHIYSGFMCEYCAEANHIEDDDKYEI